jgi:hypothetical protein
MNRLKLSKHKFTLRFTANTVLPPFIGNTIRGAFGQSLYDNFPSVCDRVFKTQTADSTPNPFVISAPYPCKKDYKTGDTLDFTMTLFGTACDYKSDMRSAVNLMCNGKLSDSEIIGTEQIYDREWSDSGAESIPHTDVLRLRFLTPTEILTSKEPLAELDFSKYIDSLFGRIAGIIDHYTENEFVVPYALVADKPFVKAEYTLKPVKFQTSGQPINGFIGTIHYFGDITRYLPYIDLGSQIHIGKKTTRSCGEYSYQVYKS